MFCFTERRPQNVLVKLNAESPTHFWKGSWLHLTPASIFRLRHQFLQNWWWEDCQAPVWSPQQWTVCTGERRCPSIHWCFPAIRTLRYNSPAAFPSICTYGVLGLHAEEEGGGEVVDLVDAGLVLFVGQVLLLKVPVQPKGQVPDGCKTLQMFFTKQTW